MNESCLIIDKPIGPTSFDIVRVVKRLACGAKVGHTGSLDPFASGVLVLLLGRATKLSHALLNADKRYRATMKLGECTDSMDRTGKITETKDVPKFTFEDIQAKLAEFKGTWMQTPPMFSAKKQNGVRLYELARKNISVDREPIAVNLYEMKLLSYEGPIIKFEVHCSKGTYIRSLADEIGRRLGTVAHLAELRRLSCGAFNIEEAVTVENLTENFPELAVKGYQNYIKLLRSEGVVRRAPAPIGSSGHFPGNNPGLQRPVNSGNSLLN